MEYLIRFINECQINLIFRMLLSCICGVVIGYERKNRAKVAGIRTHCIVACASDAVNGHILYVDGGILAYIGKQP